jgi:hypothetical protein
MATASLWDRVQSVCHQMAEKGHSKVCMKKCPGVSKVHCHVSPELADACALLGRYYEEEMKAFLLQKMDEGYDTLRGSWLPRPA